MSSTTVKKVSDIMVAMREFIKGDATLDTYVTTTYGKKINVYIGQREEAKPVQTDAPYVVIGSFERDIGEGKGRTLYTFQLQIVAAQAQVLTDSQGKIFQGFIQISDLTEFVEGALYNNQSQLLKVGSISRATISKFEKSWVCETEIQIEHIKPNQRSLPANGTTFGFVIPSGMVDDFTYVGLEPTFAELDGALTNVGESAFGIRTTLTEAVLAKRVDDDADINDFTWVQMNQ